MSQKKRAITIDDLWAMKRFGASTVSPDGRWACTPVTSFSMDGNDGITQLWLLATDGSAQKQLTRGKKDGDPQWSPDGKWIAFVAKRDEPAGAKDNVKDDAVDAAQLYLIGADGGEARRLTYCATGVSALRWFPDSRSIAFVSWVWPEIKGAKAQARRVKKDKDDKVRAYAIERNHYRYWDHWFLRGRRPHVHVAKLASDDDDGSADVRDLFAGTDFHLPPQDPDATLYDISPDGSEIAFTHDFDPDPKPPVLTDIVVMDVKRGKWRTLTARTGRNDESPRYSKDGKWIAFLSSDTARLHNDQARLALIARNNDAIVPLTFEWDRGVSAPPLWSNDSTRLTFLAETEITQPVWSLEIGATPLETTPREVLRGPHHGGVAIDLCISRDGSTLVYARGSQAHPPKLFACDAEGSGERAIEHFNDRLLDKLAIAESRSVTIAGASGDAVQMWVVTPADFTADNSTFKGGRKKKREAQRKWPLMQVIHGGPHTCWNDTWHWRWNMQLFAAHGYVVAGVNYHGSTGWGQEYISSINGDWGRRELADVEAGTDFLLATGCIDSQRVVAAGGSYGGFMVAFMNGNVRAKRYAAYVCHAGCYDWVSMMGSDGYFWFGQELGAFPWEDEARVLAQSPHHYAANFASPTLVMHGELDYRVPYYQGLAYYNTLRVEKVASRLVFFPDENHWIMKPQNSRLWYREFFDWCERHAGSDRKTKARSR